MLSGSNKASKGIADSAVVGAINVSSMCDDKGTVITDLNSERACPV